jgi:glycosyltransferase involved in cell wall biosynthesis
MKIGIICPKPPFPVIDGGNFASKVLIESLSKENEVSAIIFETDKHPFSSKSESFCIEFFQSFSTVHLNTRISFFGLIRSFLKGESYNLKRFTNDELKSKLLQFFEQEFDVLVLDSLYSAVEIDFIKHHFKGKIILRSHNLEFELWKRLSEKATNPIKRKLFGYFSKKIKQKEVSIFKEVDEIWAISEVDATKITAFTSTPVFSIGIGLHTNPIEKKATIFKAFHIGGMDWMPNKESVEYILSEIWQEDFTVPLSLVGNGTKELSSHSQNKNIQFCGRLESLNELYETHAVLVTPILSGSGIRVKLLEALSYGIPCITTRLGAEGIDTTASGIQLAENKTEFRSIINKLASENDLLSNLSLKAIKYMDENHSFTQITQKINERINSK